MGHDRCVDADAPGPVPDRSPLAMTGLRFRPAGPGDAVGLLALKNRLDRETGFMLLEPDERTEDSADVAAALSSVASAANCIVVAEVRTTGSRRSERGGLRAVIAACGRTYSSSTRHGGRSCALPVLEPEAPPEATIGVVTEPVVQLTIDIAAPAEVVFDVLTNPAQHPKIDGSRTVRRLLRGPRRLSAGSRFSMSMRLFGVRYWVTNRVVEFESNRLIAWRHFEPQRWRYELEPVTGGTRVRESFDYSSYPTVGRWIIRLAGWPERNRRAIAQTLLRLRAAAEDQTGS
jgi:uncharacterized protein YndB with AHSA1/START domain